MSVNSAVLGVWTWSFCLELTCFLGEEDEIANAWVFPTHFVFALCQALELLQSDFSLNNLGRWILFSSLFTDMGKDGTEGTQHHLTSRC